MKKILILLVSLVVLNQISLNAATLSKVTTLDFYKKLKLKLINDLDLNSVNEDIANLLVRNTEAIAPKCPMIDQLTSNIRLLFDNTGKIKSIIQKAMDELDKWFDNLPDA